MFQRYEGKKISYQYFVCVYCHIRSSDVFILWTHSLCPLIYGCLTVRELERGVTTLASRHTQRNFELANFIPSESRLKRRLLGVIEVSERTSLFASHDNSPFKPPCFMPPGYISTPAPLRAHSV